MRVKVTKQEMPKPQRPQFFLVLQAENDQDKYDLEKIVFESKNGLYYHPGSELKGADGRTVSLTMRISKPQVP